MRLDRRHLIIAILFLAGAVAYNVYSFVWRPRVPSAQAGETPLLANAPAPRAAAPGQPAFTATTIPAPPPVDLTTPPIWSRDPLLAPGETRTPQRVAAVPENVVGPDPMVRSILYSPERRLAIVDDRIVRAGDFVSIGKVVEIDRDGIVVETPGGGRRRVGLRRGPTRAERVQ